MRDGDPKNAPSRWPVAFRPGSLKDSSNLTTDSESECQNLHIDGRFAKIEQQIDLTAIEQISPPPLVSLPVQVTLTVDPSYIALTCQD